MESKQNHPNNCIALLLYLNQKSLKDDDDNDDDDDDDKFKFIYSLS